jgi:hypothetical protein
MAVWYVNRTRVLRVLYDALAFNQYIPTHEETILLVLMSGISVHSRSFSEIRRGCISNNWKNKRV